MNSVFGHLALQFATHPENLATEALAFILSNSLSASRGFSAFLRAGGFECDQDLHFETQRAGAEDARPDLKCIDSAGKLRVVVENKFWAGLTENQPVTYLKEFGPSASGLVLFVVPEKRISMVWGEVVSRCAEAGLGISPSIAFSTMTLASINIGHKVAITSWRHLLSSLSIATSSPEHAETNSNIAQLQGLCDAMDAEAFMPLRAEELDNLEIARRLVNYADLPFDIAGAAEARGLCDRKGLRETAFRHGSGTYIRIGGYNPWLGFHSEAWLTLGASPIWVNFYTPYCPIAEIREKLVRFRTMSPRRCFDFKGYVAVPLRLRPSVEKSVLIDEAVLQLGELAGELGFQVQGAETADAGRAASAARQNLRMEVQ